MMVKNDGEQFVLPVLLMAPMVIAPVDPRNGPADVCVHVKSPLR